MRAALSMASLLGLLSLGLACSDECDCPLGGTCDAAGLCTFECTTDEDCPALSCPRDEPCCDDLAACVARRCQPRTISEDRCGPAPTNPEDNDGWTDPVGAGQAYITSYFTISNDCPDEPCVNALQGLQGILDRWFETYIYGSRSRLLFEVAGRQDPTDRFDSSLTLRLYHGVDYDVPTLIINDFFPVGDDPDCCEFYPEVTQSSATEPAVLRAPAQLNRGVLRTHAVSESVVLPFPLSTDVRSLLRLHDVTMTGQLNSAGQLSEVTLFGRLLPSDLWQIFSSICIDVPDGGPCPRSLPEGARFIDLLFAASGAPDADRDGDGLECLFDRNDDGLIDACCDGDGGQMCSPSCTLIDPVHASVPSSCALSPALQDGYSVALRAELVPATLYPLP